MIKESCVVNDERKTQGSRIPLQSTESLYNN